MVAAVQTRKKLFMFLELRNSETSSVRFTNKSISVKVDYMKLKELLVRDI